VTSLKLEVALKEYLEQDTNLLALLNDDSHGFRLYPVNLPRDCKLPAVSWRRVAASRQGFYDPKETFSAWVNARIQFICYASSPTTAMEVGEAIMLALSGYEGEMSGEYVGSVAAVQEFDDAEGRSYRRVMDFLVSYEDALEGSS